MTGRRSHNRTRSDEKISDSIMERRMHILPNISHACKTKVRSPVMHFDNTYKLRGFSIPQAPPPPHAHIPTPLSSRFRIFRLPATPAATKHRISDISSEHTHARTRTQARRQTGNIQKGQAEEAGSRGDQYFALKEQGRVTVYTE